MLEYDWENSVGYWICTTSHAIRRALSNRLAEERMTLRQWEVLACLSQRRNSSQAEIAECLGIEPHTLTGIVGRMERDGWVKRVGSPTDRRRYFILPTERGQEVWQRAWNGAVRCAPGVDRFFTGRSPADEKLLRANSRESRRRRPRRPHSRRVHVAHGRDSSRGTPRNSPGLISDIAIRPARGGAGAQASAVT